MRTDRQTDRHAHHNTPFPDLEHSNSENSVGAEVLRTVGGDSGWLVAVVLVRRMPSFVSALNRRLIFDPHPVLQRSLIPLAGYKGAF